MLRNNEITRKLFDDWATTYDADLQNASGPLYGYDHSIAEAAQMVEVAKDEKVLDIGIGTGAFAALISKDGGNVWGIDPSREMLEQCRKKHPDYGLSQGTFTETGHETNMFHYAISSFCFHEVQPGEREQACQEVLRILKPGGKLLLLDIMFVSKAAMETSKERIGKYWDETEDYPQVAELDGMLRGTGFTNISWVNPAPYHWAVVGQK